MLIDPYSSPGGHSNQEMKPIGDQIVGVPDVAWVSRIMGGQIVGVPIVPIVGPSSVGQSKSVLHWVPRNSFTRRQDTSFCCPVSSTPKLGVSSKCLNSPVTRSCLIQDSRPDPFLLPWVSRIMGGQIVGVPIVPIVGPSSVGQSKSVLHWVPRNSFTRRQDTSFCCPVSSTPKLGVSSKCLNSPVTRSCLIQDSRPDPFLLPPLGLS